MFFFCFFKPLTLHLPGFHCHNGVVSKERPKSVHAPSTTDIKYTIDQTDIVLQQQKKLPIELRRAMLLSDIFTEKANQLEFTKVLRQIDQEKENAEKDQLKIQESSYQKIKQSNKKSAAQRKLLLKRSLLDE